MKLMINHTQRGGVRCGYRSVLARLRATIAVACILLSVPQAVPTEPSQTSGHPRLFFDKSEVPAIRARAATPAFKPVLESIRKMAEIDPFGPGNRKTLGNHATLYLATGDRAEADLARDELLSYMAQTDVWANPGFKALSRASLARGAAVSYDLCHDAWAGQTVPESVTWKGKTYPLPKEIVGMDLNTAVSKALLDSATALVTSGGKDWPGNGKPGNNWNAVRYGAALLALLACDEAPAATQPPFDTSLRILRQYLQAAFSTAPNANGWNPEGYGYTFYPGQFSYPAAIALARLRDIHLADDVPAFRKSFAALYSGLLALPQQSPGGFLGLHPDFTDDNAHWTGEGVANLGFSFAPPEQLPALQWLYRRAFGDLGDGYFDAASAGGLFALLYFNPAAPEKNPADVPGFGLGFSDPYHGFFSFRKSFGEPAGADILAQFYAKTVLTQGGHAAPDGLGFRIWGLGVPWTTGSGRTSNPGGQCTVFPGEPDGASSDSQVHRVLDAYLRPAGGGYVIAKAQPFSDTGVRDHTRRFLVDFGSKTGAEAAFLVADTSSNGKIWRMNTPGLLDDGTPYNVITPGDGGFSIGNKATGHRLVARVLHPAQPVFRTGTFKRGSPMSSPLGLGRDKGAASSENAWIDFASDDGTFVVAFVLLRSGQSEPKISSTVGADGVRTVRVGDATYTIDGDRVLVAGWERPKLKIESPSTGTIFPGGPQTIPIAGSASAAGAPVSAVSISVDGGPSVPAKISGTGWSATTPPLPTGDHEVNVRAIDKAGETSEEAIAIRISKTRPPEIHLASPAPDATLPANAPVKFTGTLSDPDGPVPGGVELIDGEGNVLAKAAPEADGRWSIVLPDARFKPGRHTFSLRAMDSSGDVATLAPFRLVASLPFSDVGPFGDLAAWTSEREWRVALQDDAGNSRYTIAPSEGYKLRRGLSYLADRTVTGDFRARFKVRLRSADSVFQLRFGRDFYLTLGGTETPASAPPGLGYPLAGERTIGTWKRPLIPDLDWHVVEVARTGDTLKILLDDKPYFSLTLCADRSVSATPDDLVTWDKRNGPEGRDGGALSRIWGAGPFGFGCPFADKSQVQMDDFEFTEPAP